ncbi:hypothetical protein CCACVL1_22772, partial [Corchorus capsularis]
HQCTPHPEPINYSEFNFATAELDICKVNSL